MLRGASSINIDTKGRLAMPTRYRDWLIEECQGQMVCTVDISHTCLLLYPLTEWEEIEKKLRRLSTMQPNERRLQRMLLGHADDCTMDSNGRLLISQPLRAHAGLEKKVMLVGQLNKFEVWSEAQWQAQIQADIDHDGGDDFLSDNLKDFSL